MNAGHKNKTLSCALSVFGGALGLHRFYLRGLRDIKGWLYVGASSLYLVVLVIAGATESVAVKAAALFPLPMFVAAIEGLVIGLTDDEKWDGRHNIHSRKRSRSRWPLAVLLVLTLAITYIGFVAGMARATDLLYTGGSYG